MLRYTYRTQIMNTTNVLRSVASGLAAMGMAIAGVAISEVAATTSGWHGSRAAYAQDAGERVSDRAGRAVVTIRAGRDYYGSGSIIRANGLILTNAHVVKNERTVTVVLQDGRTLTADVVAYGQQCLDLALVQIRNQTNLPTIAIAKPESVKQGQQVFAIGSPGMLDNSMTSGIVSRVLPKDGLIQTDASIRPGNSGGPLLNNHAAMIGVNTFIKQAQNAAFAISSDRIESFLQEFDRGIASTRPTDTLGHPSGAQPVSSQGSQINGSLTSKDGVFCKNGSFFDEYTFNGNAGQPILIYMASKQLIPALTLYSPTGKFIDDLNTSGDYRAAIITHLPDTGKYRLIANARDGGQSGAYTLSVLPLVMWRRDTLQLNDPTLSNGSLYREYVFQGQTHQSITILATSSEFDTRVCLIGPAGKQLGCNDNETPKTTNSTLKLKLPQAGSYTVVVSAARRGKGSFFLTIH
ncbi:MAG: trypsin-like serine protease [Leptolyngbyaceae cyanobacterium RU_5_1]|nr:trypsin-like serine protease [Leptolyngbyaceae cyanobacterium RU_5_1]